MNAALEAAAPPAGVVVAASSGDGRKARGPQPLWVDLTSGTMAGISQLAVGHPFDTVKVKLQNMPQPKPGEAPMYSSAIDAARKTVAADGVAGLYAGVQAPLAFVAVFNAVLFAANATMKSIVGKGRHTDQLSTSELATCGAGAGLAVSFVACPTELVKCRLQTQAVPMGAMECARAVVRVRGLTGLYKGMGATLAREMPANGFYFASYELVKRKLARGRSTDELGGAALMTAGGVAGVSFWGSVYPMDVIKTRIQTDSDTNPKYRGIVDCARKIVRTEGVGALYRGVGPCLARAFPANAVTFLVFELTKNALSRDV